MILAVLQTALAVLIFMSVFYVLAQFKRDNSIVDVVWGLGFVLVSILTLWRFEPGSALAFLVNGVVFIWGWRLSFHIFRRKWGKPEDFRYQAFRKKWGAWYLLRGFTDVFLLQGLILMIVALPIVHVNFYDPPFHAWAAVGLMIWGIGFFFEAVGDFQLSRFLKTKKPGQIMQMGLWRYTRHPNYFGEVLMWWGIFLMAFSSLQAWYLVISPLLITYLILFVSGVPMLEKKYANDPAYQRYAQKTSRFWPRFKS